MLSPLYLKFWRKDPLGEGCSSQEFHPDRWGEWHREMCPPLKPKELLGSFPYKTTNSTSDINRANLNRISPFLSPGVSMDVEGYNSALWRIQLLKATYVTYNVTLKLFFFPRGRWHLAVYAYLLIIVSASKHHLGPSLWTCMVCFMHPAWFWNVGLCWCS